MIAAQATMRRLTTTIAAQFRETGGRAIWPADARGDLSRLVSHGDDHHRSPTVN